jgi:hypothetical protein
MTAVNPPTFIQSGGESAESARRALGTLVPGQGVVGSGDLAVTATGTPDMHVHVAAGDAWVEGTDSSAQGSYYVHNDASVSLTISASDPTNGRIDLIVAKVQDSQYTGATDAWSLAVVTGTAAPSPVAPPAPNNSIVLAHVSVAASVSSINSGAITDLRPVAPVGANLPLGLVAMTTSVTTPGSFSSPSATALATTCTFDGSRSYKVTACFTVEKNASSGEVFGALQLDGTTVVGNAVEPVNNSGDKMGFDFTYLYQPGSDGSHTLQVLLGPLHGGSARLNASATNVALLMIEDIGPA